MDLLTRNYIDPSKRIIISLEGANLIFNNAKNLIEPFHDQATILKKSESKLIGKRIEYDPVTGSNTILEEPSGRIQYEIFSDGVSFLFEINNNLDLNKTGTIEARSNRHLIDAIKQLGNRAFYDVNTLEINEIIDLPDGTSPKQLMFNFNSSNREIILKKDGEYLLSTATSYNQELVATSTSVRAYYLLGTRTQPAETWSINNDQYHLLFYEDNAELITGKLLNGEKIDEYDYYKSYFDTYEKLDIPNADKRRMEDGNPVAVLEKVEGGNQAILTSTFFPRNYFLSCLNLNLPFHQQLLFSTLVENAERNKVGENLINFSKVVSEVNLQTTKPELELSLLEKSTRFNSLGIGAISDFIKFKNQRNPNDTTLNVAQQLFNSPIGDNFNSWRDIIKDQYDTAHLSGIVYESHLIFKDPTKKREPFSIGIFIDNDLKPIKESEFPLYRLFDDYNNRLISSLDLLDTIEKQKTNWNLSLQNLRDGGFRIKAKDNPDLGINVKVKLYTESYEIGSVIDGKKLLFNNHEYPSDDIRVLNNAKLKWFGIENNFTSQTINPIVSINRELYVNGYDLNQEIESIIYKNMSGFLNKYLQSTEMGDSISIEIFNSKDKVDNPLSIKVELKNNSTGVSLNLYKKVGDVEDQFYFNNLGQNPTFENIGFQMFQAEEVIKSASKLVNELSVKFLSAGLVLEDKNKALIIEKIIDSKLIALANGIFEKKYLQLENKGQHHECSVSSSMEDKILSQISIKFKGKELITVSESSKQELDTKKLNQHEVLTNTKPIRSNIHRI